MTRVHMSRIELAISLVKQRGAATVDEILPHMDCTREQAQDALRNATSTKRLICDGQVHVKGQSCGSLPATYRAIPIEVKPRRYSVFNLAELTAVA